MDSSIRFGNIRSTKKQNILPRPRVNALLSDAAQHSLVTVSAGTGYGKSQAVSSFLEDSGLTNLWLHLTNMDNYPTHFWHIFTRAMQSYSPALSKRMQSYGFPDSYEKILNFMHDFSEEIHLKGRLILVLDDFHKIDESSIIHFIETLSFAGIPTLTLFLLTRQPLMLDYARLQTENRIASIGASDLRFSEEETAAYFQLAGLSFQAPVLQNIQNSTEGWPLAIYLVGLHYKKQGRLFDDPIACTIPLLYNLMESDVFADYPPDIQNIFIKLSLMESIPLNLMQVLSGKHFADMAAYLRQNMFVSYNAQTEHYHFHRLFRLFLVEKQAQFSDEELGRVRLVIGDWYKAHGQHLEALVYYQQCGNAGRMWQVIRQFASISNSTDFAQMCIPLLDSFPPEFIEANPSVRITRALLLMYTGNIEMAYRHFLELQEEYESLPLNEDRKALLGEIYLQLGHIHIMHHSYAFSYYYKKAAEYLPEGSSIVTSKHVYVGNNNALNLFDTKPGTVDTMLETLFDTMPHAIAVMNGCGTGQPQLAAAEAHLLRGNFADASLYAAEAAALAKKATQHDIVYNAFLVTLRVHFASGSYKDIVGCLRDMQAYTDKLDDVYMHGMDEITGGWFFAQIGYPEKVAAWITSNEPDTKYKVILTVGRERLIKALCLLQTKEYFELLALLDSLEGFYNTRGMTIFLLHVHILRAICLFRLGNQQDSLLAFRKAYGIAYGDRLFLPFAEYAGETRAMLEPILASSHGMDTAWLETLQTKASTYAKKRAAIAREYARRGNNAVADKIQLTLREKEILGALCKGLTREEIAAEHSISINTVKAALTGIFGKLGAINRADAVRIAINLNLLS